VSFSERVFPGRLLFRRGLSFFPLIDNISGRESKRPLFGYARRHLFRLFSLGLFPLFCGVGHSDTDRSPLAISLDSLQIPRICP